MSNNKVPQLDGNKRKIDHHVTEELTRPQTPFQPTDEGDKDKGPYKHELDNKPKNFDQKLYMFPESYNALRKELVENWPEIWKVVGWFMAHDAPSFVEIMNEATQLRIQFDTDKVSWICDQYWKKLREMRKGKW